MDNNSQIELLAGRARRAAAETARISTKAKNAVLGDLASRIESGTKGILQANERDVAAARQSGLSEAKLRRLALSADDIRRMAEGLRQVAALEDPVGKVTSEWRVPSGLVVKKIRCPIGVIMMIYEARPNVTIDGGIL